MTNNPLCEGNKNCDEMRDKNITDNSYFSDKTFNKARIYIQAKESFRPEAYKPVKNDRWTIGYGHTENVKPGDKITKEEAEKLFGADLKKFCVALKNVKVPLSENEKIALISLIYNIGAGAFIKSTLLKKLNNGDKKGAANEFDKWVYQNGRILKGLVNRRKSEKLLFLTPDE